MDRYRCPTVLKSWLRGTISPCLHGRGRAAEGGQPLGVVQVHALGTLKEHEVLERGLAERQQGQVHAAG